MEGQRRRASSKTALGKALQYALGRWEALTRYAGDGRLAIDNNLAERLLRGIAVTRKNFLFLGSDKGGERAAILYTLIETAKLNGLNPEAYLAYAINQLARARLPQGSPNSCLGTARASSKHAPPDNQTVNRGHRLTLTVSPSWSALKQRTLTTCDPELAHAQSRVGMNWMPERIGR